MTIAGVSAFHEDGTALAPRHVALTADDGTAYSLFVTAGIADVFTDAGHAGAARLAAVTEAMLPDLAFYAEAATIGIFHGDLESVRLLLATPGQDHDWQADLWPYEGVPVADLGCTGRHEPGQGRDELACLGEVLEVLATDTVLVGGQTALDGRGAHEVDGRRTDDLDGGRLGDVDDGLLRCGTAAGAGGDGGGHGVRSGHVW